MNTQKSKATKLTSYQLVFGQQPQTDLQIISMLHQQNIIYEKDILLENQSTLNNDNQSNITINDYDLTQEESQQANCFYILIEDSDQESYISTDNQSCASFDNHKQLHDKAVQQVKKKQQLIHSVMKKCHKTKRTLTLNIANKLEPLSTNDYPALDVIPLGVFVSLRNAATQQNLTRPIWTIQDNTDNLSIQDQTTLQVKKKIQKKVIRVIVIVAEQTVQLKVVHAAKTMHFVLDVVVAY
ncbi:13317_t:CDS:2 [Cetraspora pellucida]|uniref:13317_t:CDS:1 n=1 Tax=Cetraspora pellucida TaxID=1433469 RepID=A0ACA9KR87_9GLOM|nr:13317_t:CDS:2 [Cetraspora pellucida]